MPIIQTWATDDDYLKILEIKKAGPGAWTEFIRQALNKIDAPPRAAVEAPVKTVEAVKQLFGDAHVVDFCSHGADRKFCRLATVKNGIKLCRSK